MEVDFTQWWVPAIVMILLGTYVFYSGLHEYRMPQPAAPAPGEADVAEVAAAASPRRKRGLVFRTSWIWGSLLVGAIAQAYLSYIAP